MNSEKIDYERMGEDYFSDHGGIECALRKIDMPVYVIFRHGVYKRYLSRSAAIERLAQVMASHVFNTLSLPIRHDSVFDPNKNAWILGGQTKEYFECRIRAKRRILRLLAKQRDKEKWQREYDEWVNKHDELMKRRPH